ncbi:hypothetical protein PoB_006748600 [Plakobranchus ocellatus]|uniref:Uncharacterized protein n=1 Tax=Plakobranchus ocellatus TaxID=259542 RepID=A0AAV4DAN7_9GAST|nr:hypothetical protein PoB_006748600 [Plakobranchus ocellatus]
MTLSGCAVTLQHLTQNVWKVKASFSLVYSHCTRIEAFTTEVKAATCSAKAKSTLEAAVSRAKMQRRGNDATRFRAITELKVARVICGWSNRFWHRHYQQFTDVNLSVHPKAMVSKDDTVKACMFTKVITTGPHRKKQSKLLCS